MARASRAALWIAAFILCGCGTVANLSTGARLGWKNAYIYGGVRRDVLSAEDWVEHNWTSGQNLDIMQDIGTVVGVALVGIDVPLSAVGDTLTLPITIPAALLCNPRNGASANREPVAAPPNAAPPGPPK